MDGASQGKVAIVEFTDFQCPFCARFANGALRELTRTVIDTGRAVLITRHFPLTSIHPFALEAAVSAICASRRGLGRRMHDELFLHSPNVGRSAVSEWSGSLGLDDPAFSACLSDKDVVEEVRRDVVEGKRLGVVGTPSVFIGKVDDGSVELLRSFQGAVPAEALLSAIEDVEVSNRRSGSSRPM